MFNLRTLMTNFVVYFDVTFAELAARPGVAEAWQAHIDVADRGDVPRQRWKSEASEAVALLRSAEFAGKQVVFICEAQMLLDDVYQVRKHMHEVRDEKDGAVVGVVVTCLMWLVLRVLCSHACAGADLFLLPVPALLFVASCTRATVRTAASC